VDVPIHVCGLLLIFILGSVGIHDTVSAVVLCGQIQEEKEEEEEE